MRHRQHNRRHVIPHTFTIEEGFQTAKNKIQRLCRRSRPTFGPRGLHVIRGKILPFAVLGFVQAVGGKKHRISRRQLHNVLLVTGARKQT